MKNYFDLTGRVAIVSGASSGIGRAYSKALAEQGAVVAPMARRIQRLEELQKEIEADGGTCFPVQCDVTIEDNVVNAVQQVKEKFGKIDILVNVAGAIEQCPTTELPLEKWKKVVDVSLTGYFLMAREVGKVMIENNYGRIINTASMFGKISADQQPILVYNATKGAVPNFTRSLAQEWAQYHITVNAIGPGMFPTEMMVMTDDALQLLKMRCPMRRPGELDELVGQMLLFASDAATYTTGQTIYIDGGWTAI